MTPSFTLRLPDGFVDLPLGELTGARFGTLAQDVATLFGQTEVDAEIAVASATLAEYAREATREGAIFAAAGIFTSPDRTRPIMVRLRCGFVPESPESGDVTQESRTTERIREDVELETRTITTIRPAPNGIGLAMAVSSANVEDWPRISDLARGVFETLVWDQA